MKKFIIVFLILLALGLLGYWGYRKYFTIPGGNRQAVFMSNGQVYFGYISNANQPMVKLSDVYYLKTADLQSRDSSKKILLVKMGNELHSPENAMFINREQILFYQNISDGSKINEAIRRFSESQTVTPSTQ